MFRKKLLLLIPLTLLISGIIYYCFFLVLLWDGEFELKVIIQSDLGRPIKVQCITFARYAEANRWAEKLRDQSDMSGVFEARSFTNADPFDGLPVRMRIPVGGRESMLGITYEHSQFEWLVVIAVFNDGQHFCELIEIPDCRKSKTITVKFPP